MRSGAPVELGHHELHEAMDFMLCHASVQSS
jgi:hypothetical protein